MLLGVVTLVFFLFNILPGDPARMMLGEHADAESIEIINRDLGRDKPVSLQYLNYLNDLLPISLHNNLDRYTFNEEENKGFQCMPVNICLNDIGVQSTKFYGTDTETLTSEFLHARNEIWTQYHKMAHLTTNLTTEQLKQKYKDGFGRLLDRFKTYNIIPLTGESRR